MKYRIALAFLAIMSASFTALAEDEKSALTDKQLRKMQEQLQLTDDQVSEMRQIRDDGGTRKEMRAILTDEQKAQAKSKDKEARPAMTDEKLDKMQKQLQLSDEQVEKMRLIREDGGTRKDMLAVLNEEQRAQAKEINKKRKEKGGDNVKSKAGDDT